jgi:hypothetical protein
MQPRQPNRTIGIDKLTRRRGLALLDEDLSVQHVDTSAHAERILTSEETRRFNVPVADFVNLSVPTATITQHNSVRSEYDYVIHDRDSIFPIDFEHTIENFGMRALNTPYRHPKANSIDERLLASGARMNIGIEWRLCTSTD